MSAQATIHLEDQGQEFLSLTVDEFGHILRAEPAGYDSWKHRQIIRWTDLEPGDEVDFKEAGKFNSCTFPVKWVEVFEDV